MIFDSRVDLLNAIKADPEWKITTQPRGGDMIKEIPVCDECGIYGPGHAYDCVYINPTAKSSKEKKIIDLVHKYFFAKEKYKALGMVNTFGQTPEFRKQLAKDYALTINEMAECRQTINRLLLGSEDQGGII